MIFISFSGGVTGCKMNFLLWTTEKPGQNIFKNLKSSGSYHESESIGPKFGRQIRHREVSLIFLLRH